MSNIVIAPQTIAEYEVKYHAAKLLPEYQKTLKARCALIRAHKSRFEGPAATIGVPWFMVGLLMNQERGSDVGVFKCCLHNGEAIIGKNKKTSLVPAGRGPFSTWEEAAIDALLLEKKKFPKEWTIGGCLEFSEKYNGLGYRSRGFASPYVWRMTDQYTRGHFTETIVDGKPKSVFDPNAVSENFGVAAMLKTMEVFK